MSRSAYEIACTGRDDLYSMHGAFENLKAIFTVMKKVFPEGCVANDFAQLCTLEAEAWQDKVYQWAECMDYELIDAKVGGAQ
jgi:hypothetical protein